MSGFAVLISAAGALFAAAGAVAFSAPFLMSTVAVLLVTSQFVLIEQTIVGVPVRLIVLALAAVVLAGRMLTMRKPIFRAVEEQAVGLAWLTYVVVILFVYLINGTIGSLEDVVDFVGRYGVALIIFHVVLEASRRPSSAALVAGWLFVLALLNVAFVVIQFMGITWAFDLHDALFPSTARLESDLQSVDAISSFGYLPGLSSFSIATGYVISCFGVLGLAPAFKQVGALRGIQSVAIVLVLLSASVLILSRSSMAAVGMSAALTLMLYGSGTLRPYKLVAGAALVGVLVAVALIVQSSLTSALPAAARLLELRDPQRLSVIESVVAYVSEYPWVGGYQRAFDSGAIGLAAHNFVANGLLYFGVIGFVAMMLMLVVSAWSLARAIERTPQGTARAVAVAAAIGLAAYMFKSLFHNESVVTSGIMYMTLMGLSLGAAYAGRRGNEGSGSVAGSEPPARASGVGQGFAVH